MHLYLTNTCTSSFWSSRLDAKDASATERVCLVVVRHALVIHAHMLLSLMWIMSGESPLELELELPLRDAVLYYSARLARLTRLTL